MLTQNQAITYAQDGQEICRIDQNNLDRFLMLAKFEPFIQIALHIRHAQPRLNSNNTTCILSETSSRFEPHVVQIEDLIVDRTGMLFFSKAHFYTITYEGIPFAALRTTRPEQTLTKPYSSAIINPFPTLESSRTTRPAIQPIQRAYF